jgi:hypothetical protein
MLLSPRNIKFLRAYPTKNLNFGKFSASVPPTPSDSLEPFRAHNLELWVPLGTCDDPIVALSDPYVHHYVFHRCQVTSTPRPGSLSKDEVYVRLHMENAMILIIMILSDPASDQRPGECGKRPPKAEETLGVNCRCSIGPQHAERSVKDRDTRHHAQCSRVAIIARDSLSLSPSLKSLGGGGAARSIDASSK